MEASRGFWGVPRFDLMQVHNLLDWSSQLPQLLEMKAATAPDGTLVVACGRLQNGDQQGVFSATYDPDTITSTGQAVYRLQDNVMNGKRSVETGNMSVSQVGADLILADCAYVGLL